MNTSWSGIRQVFLEMQQLAEWLRYGDAFDDVDRLAIDGGGVDAERRLLVVLAQSVHQLVPGGDTLGERGVGQGRNRVREQLR
jgi:hypothetical protein